MRWRRNPWEQRARRRFRNRRIVVARLRRRRVRRDGLRGESMRRTAGFNRLRHGQVQFTQDVPKLKLKWAFGFPGVTTAFGTPTVYGGRLFVGSADGTVYSLNAQTGCIYWMYKANDSMRTAIAISGQIGRERHTSGTCTLMRTP